MSESAEVRSPFTKVERDVWAEWNALPDDLPAPVKEIARRLGMEPVDVAFIVYPAEICGPWQDNLEPEDIMVVLNPDPDAALFDDAGTPILQLGRHPEHGPGWTLFSLDANGGVSDHFIPGDRNNLDDVVQSARAWLKTTE